MQTSLFNIEYRTRNNECQKLIRISSLHNSIFLVRYSILFTNHNFPRLHLLIIQRKFQKVESIAELVAAELYFIAIGILLLRHLLALYIVNGKGYVVVGLVKGDLGGLGEGVG